MYKTALSFYIQQNLPIHSRDHRRPGSLEWLLCPLPPAWGSLTKRALIITLRHPGGSSLPLEEEPFLLVILSYPCSPQGPSSDSFFLLGYALFPSIVVLQGFRTWGVENGKGEKRSSILSVLRICCIQENQNFHAA